ncbi:hypothetical protein L596_005642 [Steinernema carpocapsae]|uniref:protein-tyrosine-phosphatase n=1 Tax=Steinernema carpocapsae TaxID=34508 RepID=A0A4V6I8P0_STECR|nr:hypothetical protein L596_005642 [Steinernema carpocapsae]
MSRVGHVAPHVSVGRVAPRLSPVACESELVFAQYFDRVIRANFVFLRLNGQAERHPGTRHHPRLSLAQGRSVAGPIVGVQKHRTECPRRLDPHASEQEFATKYFLVDCRYPYEYFGGHIRNATNIFDPSVVENTFYPEDPTEADFMRSRIPIFYCEFSQKRGPTMGYKLREVDRMRNNDKYPRVDFPEIYLLDRGYSNFFVTPGCKAFCEPMNYVRMFAEQHKETRRMSFHRSKSQSLLRTPASRCNSVCQSPMSTLSGMSVGPSPFSTGDPSPFSSANPTPSPFSTGPSPFPAITRHPSEIDASMGESPISSKSRLCSRSSVSSIISKRLIF